MTSFISTGVDMPLKCRWDLKEKIRRELRSRDGDKCYLCGQEMAFNKVSAGRNAYATIDHVVPTSQGGTDELSNLKLAHYVCNNFKASYENTAYKKSTNGDLRFLRLITLKK